MEPPREKGALRHAPSQLQTNWPEHIARRLIIKRDPRDSADVRGSCYASASAAESRRDSRVCAIRGKLVLQSSDGI